MVALTVFKRARKYVSIGVLESALAIHDSRSPLSNVPGAVREDAGAATMTSIILERALVALGTVAQWMRRKVRGLYESAGTRPHGGVR